MDENTFLQTIENSYKETDDGELSTLSVLLTPMDLLKTDERFARAKLYQIDSEEIELDIVHDRFNENDNKALEAYYDKTFIGYVRKRFDNEYIDNTERVEEFCFNDNKIRDLQLLWNGIEFILKGMSVEKRKKLKEEKESLLKDIYHYGDIMFGQDLKLASIELRDDKELVMAYVNIIGDKLEYASERLQNDKEVVLTALNTSINSRVVNYASNKLKNDPEIIWIASKKNSAGFKYAGKELLANKSFILKTLEKGMWWVFEYADEKLRSDKEVATCAIAKTISNIEYCSKDLQDNTRFMLMAIKQSGSALQYANNKLCSDKEVVMIAVKSYGLALKYVSEWLKDDEEVVLTALANDGRSLEYVSQRLQDNKEVTLTALTNTGKAFEYTSQRLKNDAEVLLTAVSNVDLEYWDTIYDMFEKTINDNLKDDSFLVNAIKNNVPILGILRSYYNISDKGKWLDEIDNKDIILMAYQKFDGYNQLNYASKALLSNKSFALELINMDLIKKKRNSKNYRLCLKFFSDNLRNDKDVVAAATRKDLRELQYASKELQNDRDLILNVPISEERKNAYEHILAYVGERLKNDKEVVMDAIDKDGIYSLDYAGEAICDDKEFMLLAIKKDKNALQFASKRLHQDLDIKAIINAT